MVVHKTLDGSIDERWSELASGTLGPDVSRRLCCDARLQFVLTDREVRFRDGGTCTFPGCGMASFLQSHHIWHWEDGGPTDLDNLATLCHFHHKLVHEFGWRVALVGSIVQWFRPDGSLFDPGPDPPKVEQLSVLASKCG